MARRNLLTLLDEFRRFGKDIAVVETRGYRRQKLTYAELAATALFWSHALGSRGIGPGDGVLLWGPNSSQWVACFWAVLLRGAVAVPMDAGASVDFVRRVVLDSQVKLILRDASQPDVSGGPPALVYDDFRSVSDSPEPRADYRVDPGDHSARTDIAEILFTSGTTSEPRGVVLTHGNFLANLEPLEQGLEPYRKYERWLHPLRFVSTVPLSHVFGQFMALFVPPLIGATVVFENSALPGEILRTIKRERATALIAVPRMLDALRNNIRDHYSRPNLPGEFELNYRAAAVQPFLHRAWMFRSIHRHLGWKFWAFISGGAALSPETEEFFKRLGYAVVQGYGMTETASLISLNHPFRATEGSVGKILPGREFRLAEDGEILVRGENVSAGYWEKGAFRQAGDENDGWLRTGDFGELDAVGNLRFRGRKKNVIVTPAGLNIYPEDLESALRKQPAIRDAVVIPVDVNGNAEPCAVLLLNPSVIPSGGPAASAGPQSRDRGTNESSPVPMESPLVDQSSLAARAAIDAANASLADYQRIRRWLIWPDPDFPRTPTGKPRLALITSRASNLLRFRDRSVIPSVGPAVFAGPESRDRGKTEDASSSMAQLLGDPSLLVSGSPTSLKDLSSLDRVELLSMLEHRYNVELNETQFANAQSIDDIQHLLTQPLARRSDYVYPRWTQRAPVRLFRLIVYYALTWPATLLLAHPRTRGCEHLANLKGPALFVANHTTRRADIGLILYSLPARFRHRLAAAMGGETLQTFRHPPREWFFVKRWLWRLSYFLVVSLFNVFPLPQLSGFRESFRFAGESADRGYSLLVFPEGIVNDRDSADMIPFQPGIGLLAQNLRIPIVPMRLDGVWQMKQEHRRLARFGELTIHIGAPVTFPPDTPPAKIASRLQSLVQSL
jgi:long-chain acyl-CoA synthetase